MNPIKITIFITFGGGVIILLFAALSFFIPFESGSEMPLYILIIGFSILPIIAYIAYLISLFLQIMWVKENKYIAILSFLCFTILYGLWIYQMKDHLLVMI